MYRKLALLICAALSITVASAQTESDKQKELFHNYSKLLSPEKVYLHTDKDVYFATDTIWFSGYVENASYASEFDESNYIYVELISDQLVRDLQSLTNYDKFQQDVVVRKKIKRLGNCFYGNIVVPELHSTGRAIIRAYTYWMLNRPVEYLFYKELEITNPMKDKLVAEMRNKKVRNREDYFRIGESSNSPGKTVVDKERYDVQFLPESGNYISGANSVVYIKCLNTNGMGASMFGEIYDSSDSLVARYSTDELGFGKVLIPKLPKGKLYATVKDSLGYEGKNVALPMSVQQGVTINGIYSGSLMNFDVFRSDDLCDKALDILIHNSSEVYYSRKFAGVSESLSLLVKDLPSGIHSVLVSDDSGNIYAERPFVILPADAVGMEVETQNYAYGKRELVEVKLKLPADLIKSESSFSVAVTDMQADENLEKTTMQSYMLLKSELAGYIEGIDWYFNDSIPYTSRMKRADLLMQTQGWRYYETEKILQGKSETPYFGREYKQTLFGKVQKPIGMAKKSTVSFLAPSINFRAMGEIDSGYFVLKDVSFPEGTRFIVSATDKKGNTRKFTPVLQEDYYAPLYDYPVKKKKITYTKTFSDIVESIYFNKDDGEHAMAFELNPVIVTTQMITPKNSPSPIPDYPIRREWYRDSLSIKPYVQQNCCLGEFVAATYPGTRYSWGGYLTGPKLTPSSRMTPGGRVGPVLVYVDGISTAIRNSWLPLQMPLSDIESVIYISGLSATPFQTSETSMDIYPSPVLMVKTKLHKRIDGVPYNVYGGEPLGWQKPARFYSPKYDTPESKKSKAKDNRITLYWNPAVKLDENGEDTISFYTSDSDSQYRIEVEGRSSSRQYHYAEKIIERNVEPAGVKKK